MKDDQLDLFAAPQALPEGLRYHAEVLSPDEERSLLREFESLPFREFEFQGYLGKRRVVSYGWRYDFNEKVLRRSDDVPEYLKSVRELAARFAGIEPDALQQALVSEYSAGAGIGWHRDKAMFGDVIGISLLAPCVFRLRRRRGSGWERRSFVAEPRSAYLLRGPSRTEWEHSVPSVETLRYSITFRTFLESFVGGIHGA
jgi:alkylated DNA repair dioxygenase AlkB